jgi:hypothetical protein
MTRLTDPKAERRLLGEIEDIIRTGDAPNARHPTPENFAWFGRAQAAMSQWDPIKAEFFRGYVSGFQSGGNARLTVANWPKLMTMLNEARMDLRSRVAEPLAEVFADGQPFEYFNEVRKLVQLAQTDLLFVDPYIDAEFIRRYLPHVGQSVSVRLLTHKHVQAAASAVEAVCVANTPKGLNPLGLKIARQGRPHRWAGMLLLRGIVQRWRQAIDYDADTAGGRLRNRQADVRGCLGGCGGSTAMRLLAGVVPRTVLTAPRTCMDARARPSAPFTGAGADSHQEAGRLLRAVPGSSELSVRRFKTHRARSPCAPGGVEDDA